MASSDKALKDEIHYFSREQMYFAMQDFATQGLRRYPGQDIFKLYHSLALLLQNKLPEATSELESLQQAPGVKLAAYLALIYALRRSSNTNKDQVAELDVKVKEERKKASEETLYHAALFLNIVQRYDKAREYADRMLKLNPTFQEGLILKGWIDLRSQDAARKKDSLQYFTNALVNEPRRMDALMGKFTYHLTQGEPELATEVVNQLIVTFSNNWTPLAEKLRLQISLKEWDPAKDALKRALNLNPDCLMAVKFQILQTLCRDGSTEDAGSLIRQYFSILEKNEPRSANLFYEAAQLYSRVCGNHMGVLAECQRLAERAAQLDFQEAEFVTELARQHALQGKVKEALRFYKTATKLDEASIPAVCGVTWCLLEDGQLDTAQQQLDFLQEILGAEDVTSEFLYLKAVYIRKRNTAQGDVIGLLDQASEVHLAQIKGFSYGAEFLIRLNPALVTQITNEYLFWAPTEPLGEGQSHAALTGAIQIMEFVILACPGLLPALYALAKACYLNGDFKAAHSTVQRLLQDVDPTFAEGHLLMAQIQLHQGNYTLAGASLEKGLSYNFHVREYPLYHLISAKVFRHRGEVSQAVTSLHTAMVLTGLKPSSAGMKKAKVELSTRDQAVLYLELITALQQTNQKEEAGSLMQEALTKFRGTGEEGLVWIAHADYLIARGDIQAALQELKALPPQHPQFISGREKMAAIYLHKLQDKRSYANCYKEIVEKKPSLENFVRLGDAFLAIHQPDKAVEAYEAAAKNGPRDSKLAAKIGQALVKTHQFIKAINYYKDALRDTANKSLRCDLAELQLKLGQVDKAERTIREVLLPTGTLPSDLSRLLLESQLLSILAQIQDRNQADSVSIMSTLKRAHEIQTRVVKRVINEQPELILDQKHIAAKITMQMGACAAATRDFDAAIRFYKEALTHAPDDTICLTALAKLYLHANDLEHCQYMCKTLLRVDKENDAATLMLAQMAFRKSDHENALLNYRQVLDRLPTHYDALAQYIEACRRHGSIELVGPYLETAAQKAVNENVPGLAFCQGLHQRYCSQPNPALLSLNRARHDEEWGQRAIRLMIDICLNPDQATLGGEVLEDMEPDSSLGEVKDSQDMALKTASRLLQELKPRSDDVLHTPFLLANFFLLATKIKANLEKALQEFSSLAAQDSPNHKEHVGAICGMATAYMLLKQTPRARNQLKRVAKAPWTLEEAEYLEQCWLLLADIYIQSSKFDMGTELLRRVLLYNRSCSKAYEYLGHIMEKEQAYKDAAANYENAWKLSNKNNAAIGYKLAFNYLKAKRYTDAIDVSQHVLQQYPQYPRMRKDIFDKACGYLRS